jgi:hypothetical protein
MDDFIPEATRKERFSRDSRNGENERAKRRFSGAAGK